MLTFLLGLLGFSTSPALNSRFMGIAPNAPTLAVSGNIAAFNVGITLGPWLGGLALTAGFDYPAIPAIGALVAGIALALWGMDVVLQVHQRRRTGALDPAVGPS